jgi:hypothetical protein
LIGLLLARRPQKLTPSGHQPCRSRRGASKTRNGALEFDEALGRKEGIASAYFNLGTLYKTRWEAMYKRALYLYEILGSRRGVAVASNMSNLIDKAPAIV